LNIIDDYNREVLLVKAQLIFPGEHVINALNDLVFYRGIPSQIRVDNGPEFLSKVFTEWCQENNVKILYIQPGKPVQNAFIERFNRLDRKDVLDAFLFENIGQVEEISPQWMNDYNENHPHGSLGGVSPRTYVKINQKNLADLEEKSKISLS
jgi:putative transposase